MREPRTTDLEKIELAVRERQTGQARNLIAAYVKEQDHSLEARLRASEYYRRFSDYHSALKILGSERSLNDFGGDSAIASSAKLHLARVLNLLGASSYALRILAGIRPAQLRQEPDQGRDAAIEIYNSNYLYQEALGLFKPSPRLKGLSYKERLGLLSHADAYFGAGFRAEAIDLLDQLLEQSTERVLIAIANQIKGSFLLLNGNLTQAEQCLETSSKLFGDSDGTLDRGYLDKWIGALLLEKKRYIEASERLKRAWRILYRPGFKPEGWLEVVYWQGLVSFRQKQQFPQEWSRIVCFPGSTRSRFVNWIENTTQLPSRVLLDCRSIRRTPSPHCIDLESNVRILPNEGVQYGLNLPDLLAALLIRTGSYGIPLFRASETLWPDELFSFNDNLKRIEQVILRSKKEYDLFLRNETLHLKIKKSPSTSCLWVRDAKPPGWLFLREHESFTREQVEKYFQVSKRTAVNICRVWLDGNCIVQRGNNRASTYKRRPENT